MKNESIAILDIRSFEITFLIGKKGINGTFVFLGSKSEKYEGYTNEGFIDVDSFTKTVQALISSVLQGYDGKINRIYVGVPSAFVKIYTKGQTISFPSKRKISEDSFDTLFNTGISEWKTSGFLNDEIDPLIIRRSAMYYSLGDNRKFFSSKDLTGMQSSTLKGALCYYCANEEFVSAIKDTMEKSGFEDYTLLPDTLAQTMYLLPEKKREGYAFLVDIGYLNSSVTVVYGGGIVHEESFDFGVGQIIMALMDGLEVEFEKAEEIILNANISGGITPKDIFWTDDDGNPYSINKINEIIKYGLDAICERVDGFFSSYYKGKTIPGFALNPLCVTGEGIEMVKGGVEHIAKRLGRVTINVCPDIPYYDKPMYSSRISLLSMALSDEETKSNKKNFFKFFGGKK